MSPAHANNKELFDELTIIYQFKVALLLLCPEATIMLLVCANDLHHLIFVHFGKIPCHTEWLLTSFDAFC